MASKILILLGEEMIKICCTGLIESAFQCLGSDFQAFLATLDGIHDVLKLEEDGIIDTEFICAGDGELIFTTERPVIAWLLLGSFKALIHILFNIDVSIVIEPIEGESKCYRYLFTLPEQYKTAEQTEEPILPSTSTVNDLKMNMATFCKAFPWHFILDEELEIIQMGKNCLKKYHTRGWFERRNNFCITFSDR